MSGSSQSGSCDLSSQSRQPRQPASPRAQRNAEHTIPPRQRPQESPTKAAETSWLRAFNPRHSSRLTVFRCARLAIQHLTSIGRRRHGLAVEAPRLGTCRQNQEENSVFMPHRRALESHWNLVFATASSKSCSEPCRARHPVPYRRAADGVTLEHEVVESNAGALIRGPPKIPARTTCQSAEPADLAG